MNIRQQLELRLRAGAANNMYNLHEGRRRGPATFAAASHRRACFFVCQ